ncbi:MAG: hypothetical protein U0U70_14675 [Chitinophagaceae bacterium]
MAGDISRRKKVKEKQPSPLLFSAGAKDKETFTEAGSSPTNGRDFINRFVRPCCDFSSGILVIFVNAPGYHQSRLGVLNISVIFAGQNHYKTNNEEEHCAGNRRFFRRSCNIL